jgi:RNA polymerase sigma-70 factor (ECF subfamily)
MSDESNYEEHELVLRLIDGDEDAFCELYSAYKERLIYFALRFVKSKDYAEDIFQDVFAIIWKGRRFIDPDASFSSYLYTIVHHRVLNQLRDLDSESRLKESILAHAVDYDEGYAAPGDYRRPESSSYKRPSASSRPANVKYSR